MIRWIVIVAGIVGALGVGLGAYAAHGLSAKLTADGLSSEEIAKKLDTSEIAVRYHLVHAVALLALGAAPRAWSPKRRSLAAFLILVGLGLFCGVLYAQSMASLKGFNLIVPLGGLSFILGWVVIALAGFAAVPKDS